MPLQYTLHAQLQHECLFTENVSSKGINHLSGTRKVDEPHCFFSLTLVALESDLYSSHHKPVPTRPPHFLSTPRLVFTGLGFFPHWKALEPLHLPSSTAHDCTPR